jgi:nitrite reductase (NADH) large subunit
MSGRVHRRSLVVIGNGMVGHRLVEELAARGLHREYRIFVFGEEPRPAYDRVHLSNLFAGSSAEDLALANRDWYRAHGINLITGDPIVLIEPDDHRVTSRLGDTVRYDKLVLATGAAPFVPSIKNGDRPGCFVYRTIEDLDALRAHAAEARAGAVLGGGLLGLEAANALRTLGLQTHVVEFAPRLMALQLDEPGAWVLKRRIQALGVQVHTGKSTTEVVCVQGRVERLRFADGGELPVDLVVYSAGIRPRDTLARAAGITVGERGGVAIDASCRTSEPDVFAVGECASFDNRFYGLVGPGYQMARVAAAVLAGEDAAIAAFDMSTRLKLLGVEVASFGDAFGDSLDAHSIAYTDTETGIYKKLVLSQDKKRLLGGMLVGDASSYPAFHQMVANGVTLPPAPAWRSSAVISWSRSGTQEPQPVRALRPVATGAVPPRQGPRHSLLR